jgi:hypothetical protein
MINNSQTIINNYINICSTSSADSMTQFKTKGCTFKDSNVKVLSSQNVNQQCITSNNTQNALQSDLRQSMQQSAQAISQSFGFPSVEQANNFINQSIIVADNIFNNFINKCNVQAANASAEFVCTDSSFTNSTITIESYQNIQQTCFQQNITNNQEIEKLVSILNQSAVAQQANTFGSIALVIIIFILIIAYAGISLASSPIVQWGIVLLVLFSVVSAAVYAATAQSNGNYPYKHT